MFWRALIRFAQRVDADDASSLEGYLSRHPSSGWSASLNINLGDLQLRDGYFMRALASWEAGWRLAAATNDHDVKLLVDHAIGQIVQMRQGFGQFDEVDAVFARIRGRSIEGAATEMVQNARDVRRLANKDPRHLYVCGPVALRMLLVDNGRKASDFMDLDTYRATPKGTSLQELSRLATTKGFAHTLIKREVGQPIPTKALVHWRQGHFATVTGVDGDWVTIQDPAYPGGLRMARRAFDEEASGYMMIPGDASRQRSTMPWRTMASTEVSGVMGKGPVLYLIKGGISDFLDGLFDRKDCPLCGSNIRAASVAVSISDTPVGYSPSTGPSLFARIQYNQRNDWQSPYQAYANFGQKWTLNWNRFIDQQNATPGGSGVTRTTADGNQYAYNSYDTTTRRFENQVDDGSVLRVVSVSPIVYELTTADGSVETYSLSDGGDPYRRIYITSMKDPQGNTVTFEYQGLILKSLTDQFGRRTTITTRSDGRITRITDPFGRSATFTYDALDRLASMTDVVGLTSSFTYDANSLVNSLTTPYGVTKYRYSPPDGSVQPRFVEIEDPLGNRMREEWVDEVIPDREPTTMVPSGMAGPPKNNYLEYRNSFHWTKDAYVAAGCTSTGGCDYSKARVTHFEHAQTGVQGKSMAIESVKQPLENRVYMLYPGQETNTNAGLFNSPSSVGRVVEGGMSQVGNVVYDTTGFYKPLTVTDPAGRVTTYEYAANRIDLLSVKRALPGGQAVLMQATYDGAHNPLTVTDAAGQVTTYTYNGRGQPLTSTNALNQTTTFVYDALARLTSITNANGATAASYTYDAFDRIATATDSEGWKVSYQYDAMNRPIRATYPDGTTETRVYDKLDMVRMKDRAGRTWRYTHDANSQTTTVTNPMGQTIGMEYTPMGNIAALIDAKGNRTSWSYDLQARVTQKKFADNTAVSYAYDPTSGHLTSETDALGQTKRYAYTVDDRPSSIVYANAVNPTADVAMTYDATYGYPTSMVDGTGTTTYAYNPVGALGALQPSAETTPNGAISYAYDALGRLSTRTAAGGTAETFGYDALGRLITHGSGLGSYTYAYLGQTGQLLNRALAGSTVATSWSYGSNLNDRRLSGIVNTGTTPAQQTGFTYQTDVLGRINDVTQTSDAPSVYPSVTPVTGQYNALNQQTLLGTQPQTYDAVGQQLSDGERAYAWDAEGRLVRITYPTQPGRVTTFTYDGLGRRTAITDNDAGSVSDRRFLWCGDELCQSRTPTGSVLREYLGEGENLTAGAKLFYGVDHQGSVRRSFSTASAPAYDYSPYGQKMQPGTPDVDFTYAGFMNLPNSGLYLSSTRAYNPGVGRWLRRDMAGEASDADANLYGYANRDPINLIDPNGAAPQSIMSSAAWGAVKGLGSSWLQGVSDGDYTFCEFGRTIRAGFAGGLEGAIKGSINRQFVNILDGLSPVTGFVSDVGGADSSDAINYTAIPEGYMRNDVTIDMRDAPSSSGLNAAGYPRNGPWFWRQLARSNPEYFDSSNISLIRAGKSPRVNDTWIGYFPMHSSYEGNRLIHHHVEQGPIATPLPEKVHRSWDKVLHPNQ
jgi:RHS repeat-associated protein